MIWQFCTSQFRLSFKSWCSCWCCRCSWWWFACVFCGRGIESISFRGGNGIKMGEIVRWANGHLYLYANNWILCIFQSESNHAVHARQNQNSNIFNNILANRCMHIRVFYFVFVLRLRNIQKHSTDRNINILHKKVRILIWKNYRNKDQNASTLKVNN